VVTTCYSFVGDDVDVVGVAVAGDGVEMDLLQKAHQQSVLKVTL